MNYTWGEIQILAIQKMFLNNSSISVSDLEKLKEDRKYSLYLNSMPAVANEGLIRLMSTGSPVIKKYTLTHYTPDFMFDYSSYDTHHVNDEDLIIEGKISKSYYFEINNNATIEIQTLIDDTWVTKHSFIHVADVTGSYEKYKGIIDNEENKTRLVFKQNGYLYSVRNIALYSSKFRLDDDVYENTPKQKYDLSVLIRDFYDIVSIEYERIEKKGIYDSDYTLEGDNTLIIDSKLKGNFIITYKSYPVKITENTQDGFRFNLKPEMISLLPLYIASQLYKDDDISMATIWRNEFEVSLSNLKRIEEPMEFANNSNWL